MDGYGLIPVPGHGSSISLYQFDGRNTHIINLDVFSEGLKGKVTLSCQNKSGELIGFINATGRYFYFNPNTNKLRFYELPETDTEINFLGITKDQDLIIQASNSDQHFIYSRNEEKLQLLGKLPRSKYINGDNAIVKNEHVLLTETDLWHMDIILSLISGKDNNRTYVGKLYRINLPFRYH